MGRVIARGDPTFGDVSDWGDVTLRAKVRFRPEAPGRPALGARFGVAWAETGTRDGLGPNTLRSYAQMLLSKSAGRWAVHANAGLELFDDPLRLHEQGDFLIYGLALARRAGAHTELLAELAGLLGKSYPGTPAQSEVRAGFRWRAGTKRWDAALRRGLKVATGDWGFTLGLAWTLRGSRQP